MDTLASEYGWTKDYILECVYPLEAFSLFPKIAQRQLDHFVDLLEVQVMTDSALKPEDRTKWFKQIDRLRTSASATEPNAKPLDREGLEKLRDVMGKRKGKAPQRV